ETHAVSGPFSFYLLRSSVIDPAGPPVDLRGQRGQVRPRGGGRTMIVVMKPGASQQQIEHMAERVHQLGLRSQIIVGTERTVTAALGEKRDGAKQSLELGDGVEKVVPILAPYKIASYEVKKEPTVVEVLGLSVGGG